MNTTQSTPHSIHIWSDNKETCNLYALGCTSVNITWLVRLPFVDNSKVCCWCHWLLKDVSARRKVYRKFVVITWGASRNRKHFQEIHFKLLLSIIALKLNDHRGNVNSFKMLVLRLVAYAWPYLWFGKLYEWHRPGRGAMCHWLCQIS